MEKKLVLVILTVFVFGFATAPRSNAGTDVIEPYRAPARTYNYAPPRWRPVVFVPPVSFGVAIGPAYRFYGPRFGFVRGHRFYGRHVYWRARARHWH